ncbi:MULTISPECIES: DUF2987 domain-containing protein [Rheinheimera]|uniref:DUF2987 domain-containing protein n=1 Tax=Rheinheimera TaxID=67575 RepID=UPI0010477DDC|nr:DUF2987 domain-containing protein [Rheinheimera sp. D18]QBL09457.1 DUF2987 domain-containing protein [Rheinheimera sp. D18]
MRFLLSLLLLLATPVSADLMMNYNGFYARMKKLQQPEYSDITLAFALIGERSGQPCRFYSLKLVSDRHDIALDIAGNGEISLPYDEALKDSNAILTVLQADNAEPCQIQFKLRSRMRLNTSLELATVQHYQRQFTLLLDDMAGFSKRWLPAVEGVIVEFAEDTTTPQMPITAADVTRCDARRCYIRLTTPLLPAATNWQFNQRPQYILPLIGSSVK